MWTPRRLNSHSVDTPGPRGLAELKVSRDPCVVRSSKERNSSPSIPQRAGLPLEPWGRRPPAHTSHQAGTSAHPPHPGTPQAPHPQPVHTPRQGDQALRKQRPSALLHVTMRGTARAEVLADLSTAVKGTPWRSLSTEARSAWAGGRLPSGEQGRLARVFRGAPVRPEPPAKTQKR